jgi:hypothetical protein
MMGRGYAQLYVLSVVAQTGEPIIPLSRSAFSVPVVVLSSRRASEEVLASRRRPCQCGAVRHSCCFATLAA